MMWLQHHNSIKGTSESPHDRSVTEGRSGCRVPAINVNANEALIHIWVSGLFPFHRPPPGIILQMVATEERAMEWTRSSSQSTIISMSPPSTTTTSANTISSCLDSETILKGRGVSSNSSDLESRRRVSSISVEGRRVSAASSGTRSLLANFTNNSSRSSELSSRSRRGGKRRKSYAGSKCMYQVVFTDFPLLQSHLDCLLAPPLWQALWPADSQWVYYQVI